MTRQGGDRASPEDIKKAREEAEKKMRAEAPSGPPEEVDFFIRLTDHRKVDGVMLPHKFTFLPRARFRKSLKSRSTRSIRSSKQTSLRNTDASYSLHPFHISVSCFAQTSATLKWL